MNKNNKTSNTMNNQIEEVCSFLIKDFVVTASNPEFINIEEFITAKLGYKIVYEYFAGDDKDALGFVSDGNNSIVISRDGNIQSVTFSSMIIVIEKALLDKRNEAKRRFVLAHEAGHIVSNRMFGSPLSGFNIEFNSSTSLSIETMKKTMNISEFRANRCAAALLMPKSLVFEAIQKYADGLKFRIFGNDLILPWDREKIATMAKVMRVSYSAMFYRLKDLDCFVERDLDEYARELNM